MNKIIESKKFIDLEKRANAYKWGSYSSKNWSDWGLLFRFLVVICKLLSGSFFMKKEGKRRKPNAWSVFLGGYLKKGKTIQEAAKDWKLKNKE